MTLTQEQIEKLSKNLSKIDISDSNITQDLNNILNYVELLDSTDTSWVDATVSVFDSENILREDIEDKSKISPNDLLSCSNQKIIANQIAISNIMK